MKILITGSNGQVGWELVEQVKKQGISFCAFTRDELDITNSSQVKKTVAACKPDIIVNAAAYTAVDQAEIDVDLAYAVNKTGIENLAFACKDLNIPLIHISTDYIFDGEKDGAYTEIDTPNPLGIYGLSKLAGEDSLRNILPQQHIILRTSWVFSSHGKNFVKTMIKLAQERDEISVVSDQYGCPTSASTLADVILFMAPILIKSPEKSGTYNICQPSPTNWHGFAKVIIDIANEFTDLKVNKITAITTDAYPTKAKRPKNTVMDTRKITDSFKYTICPWKESLHKVVKQSLTG